MSTLVSVSVARARALSVYLCVFVCVSVWVNAHARLESTKVSSGTFKFLQSWSLHNKYYQTDADAADAPSVGLR